VSCFDAGVSISSNSNRSTNSEDEGDGQPSGDESKIGCSLPSLFGKMRWGLFCRSHGKLSARTMSFTQSLRSTPQPA
jgi:hypothetical protein